MVNIGIGGSDLGPLMVTQALAHYAKPGLGSHFVSNVDATHLAETLKRLDPETTLFIIASKTFTTQETMTNAASAKAWAPGQGRRPVRRGLGISWPCPPMPRPWPAFGIDTDNMFEFWDWGGRPLFALVGHRPVPSPWPWAWIASRSCWTGAHLADEHFRFTPLENNIPVVMAMLGVWYANLFGAESHAILPYDQYLSRFAAYFQQGDMESNGKSTTLDGERGGPCHGARHLGRARHQRAARLLPAHPPGHAAHPLRLPVRRAQPQSPGRAPAPSWCPISWPRQRRSCGARPGPRPGAELEKQGLPEAEVQRLLPHKMFEGQPAHQLLPVPGTDAAAPWAPSSPCTSTRSVVQGVIWNINSFDQWGVELGKQLAKAILPELAGPGTVSGHDGSTNGLINYFKKLA